VFIIQKGNNRKIKYNFTSGGWGAYQRSRRGTPATAAAVQYIPAHVILGSDI